LWGRPSPTAAETTRQAGTFFTWIASVLELEEQEEQELGAAAAAGAGAGAGATGEARGEAVGAAAAAAEAAAAGGIALHGHTSSTSGAGALEARGGESITVSGAVSVPRGEALLLGVALRDVEEAARRAGPALRSKRGDVEAVARRWERERERVAASAGVAAAAAAAAGAAGASGAVGVGGDVGGAAGKYLTKTPCSDGG
jgi:hypothetical protein